MIAHVLAVSLERGSVRAKKASQRPSGINRKFVHAGAQFNDLSCRTRIADLSYEHGFLASARQQTVMRGECQSRSIFHSVEEHSARHATKNDRRIGPSLPR